jgi:hypothetical protein
MGDLPIMFCILLRYKNSFSLCEVIEEISLKFCVHPLVFFIHRLLLHFLSIHVLLTHTYSSSFLFSLITSLLLLPSVVSIYHWIYYREHKNRYRKKQTKVVWSHQAHGRREDTKEDAGDEVEGKKTKWQAKNQVDGPSNERCRKEGEEMDAGETRQGIGRQGQMEFSL